MLLNKEQLEHYANCHRITENLLKQKVISVEIQEQKREENMALKKLEKLHNSLNGKGILIMPKSEIHPTWYPDAKVICNGEVVMSTGSTQPELHVDVWSGNHPFFTGTQKILDTEGRVDRFMKKYGMGSANSATSKEKKEDKNSKK